MDFVLSVTKMYLTVPARGKKPVVLHLFVKSAREALNAGEVPYELIRV
jgi:hypothetical protein